MAFIDQIFEFQPENKINVRIPKTQMQLMLIYKQIVRDFETYPMRIQENFVGY